MALPEHEQPGHCPYCRRVHECASGTTTEAAPLDGDVSFCIGCGRFGFFDSSVVPGGVRKATLQEQVSLTTDKNCFRLRWAWEQTIAHLGKVKP